MGQYIDFAHVKANAHFPTVLNAYEIEFKESGNELRCCCPFHEDETPSLSINRKKNIFNCHAASCGHKGNVLDFVARMESMDLREAAVKLAKICDSGLAPGKPQRRRKPADVSGADHRAPNKSQAKKKDKKAEPEERINKPLGFEIQLDPKHPYRKERGLKKATVAQLQMGYASRGLMDGRWCAPLHDADGGLVGYVGRYAASDVPEDTEKYKLPNGFHKDLVLYNLHRVRDHTDEVAIVEGFFDVARLWQLSCPAVALLGSSVSDEQLQLLSKHFSSAVIILDGGSKKAERKLVLAVSRVMPVRSLELPEGEDPATVSEEFLRGKVPVFAH